MARAVKEKYREIFDIVRDNNNMSVVIEFNNKELVHYYGETLTCTGMSELLSALHKLTSMPNIEIKKVYLLLLDEHDIKDLYDEEDY